MPWELENGDSCSKDFCSVSPRSCPLVRTSDTRDMCTSSRKYITPSGPGQLAGTRLPADDLYLTTKAGASPAQQNIELTVSQTPPDLSLGFTLSASVVRVKTPLLCPA